MNIIRKSCLFLGLAFAITYIFLFNTVICNAAGETYDTALEAAYGDTFKSVYENRLYGSPIEASEPDGVDTATGHLVITRNDLSLEGMAGMDLELKRYYDSNEANLGHATVEHIDKLEINTFWVNYTGSDGKNRRIVCNADIIKNHKKALKDLLVKYEKGEGRRGVSYDGKPEYEENTQRTKIISNEGHNVYGIATGWRYDFPWIETVEIVEDEGWGKNPKYLHYGSIGVINIDTEADESTKTYSIKGFEDYDYKDLKLEDFDKTVDGISCRYLLRDKTGLRTYFNEDGVIVLQKDAHNNSITFTYTDGIYFDKITDSVGREIVFNYSNDEDGKVLKSVSVQGEEAEGGVSKKEVTYETEEKTYTPHYGERLSGVILTSATVDGSKETYNYKTVERLVNTAGAGIASQRVSTDQSFLLTQVTSFGNEHTYEYRACSLRGTRDAEAGQERDVVTENFYVTREYEKDVKTGKKSNGIKYDYFQKKGDGVLRSYDDFREREKKEDGSQGTIYEAWQYGNSDLRTVTVVSSFNPNIFTPNSKYYDYKYEKPDINSDTLRLKNDTNKSVALYIYNENKLLTDEVNYGEEKEETLYTYDKNGEGSLVVLKTEKSYGKSGSVCVSSKSGYTYDVYRNILTEKMPKAYLAKNKGKEHLYTNVYTYSVSEDGYPSEDTAYSFCTMLSRESYLSEKNKIRISGKLTDDGLEYANIEESKSVDGERYQVLSRTNYAYDEQGNEIQSINYPSFETDGEQESIKNDYNFNSLGQMVKKTVTVMSEKNSEDNNTYVEEETSYDSFGNELTYIDEDGNISKITYDADTGAVFEEIDSLGTSFESYNREYISTDGLKTMKVDNYGRVTIDIRDGFGNTVIYKDEASGIWTESIYEYNTGSDLSDAKTDVAEDGKEDFVTTRLIGEKTYSFAPNENKFITNENGILVANFYISGRGDSILSGTKYFYDELGNEIGNATFSNGDFDGEHCSSWNFRKIETKIEGEGDDAINTSVLYSKELNPADYSPEIESNVVGNDYYDKFNKSLISETITKIRVNSEGNIVSRITTVEKGNNKAKTETSYEYDNFGNVVKEKTLTQTYHDGWNEGYVSECIYTYDEDNNLCETEIRSRKESETEWQTQTTKSEYNNLGQIVKEYTPAGMKEGVAAKYTYDIHGRKIMSEMPQINKNGSVIYQKITYEYDRANNIIKTEEQIDDKRTNVTEYSYDVMGNLVTLKNSPEDEKYQYVQYVYDAEGNMVRKFTGMTAPLSIIVEEIKDDEKYNPDGKSMQEIFSYGGVKYRLSVSNIKKSDDIRETKYVYDNKNRLVSYTDPEGRTESYTYDINDNLIKTVDKNGNILKNSYDYQNRLVNAYEKNKLTDTETVHTYKYGIDGSVIKVDDTVFEYNDISGQVTKETTRLTKNKNIEKNYTYDSVGNKKSFDVCVGDDVKLSLKYIYDGESKLTGVKDGDGKEIIDYKYDEDGNLSRRSVLKTGMTSTYVYDYQEHLVSLHNKIGSDVISEYDCDYLLNGQKSKEVSKIAGSVNESITSRYEYDCMGRLIKETKTGEEDISYSYDENNNRKEMTVGNKLTAYKYNKNDELIRTDTLNIKTEKDNVVIYKYDKNGNDVGTINRYESSNNNHDDVYIDVDFTLGSNRLNENVVNEYDAENRLIRSFTGEYKVKFTYDADGLRTSKTMNGEKTIYVWDGDKLVLELSENGDVKKKYVRGIDLIYAETGDEKKIGDKLENSGNTIYYVTDPHGNVIQLTDESGEIIRTYNYDSFGNEIEPDNKDENPFRYCGEYYDMELDKIYLLARYYNPKFGRFITRDTYTGENDDSESLHLYTYCNNDSVNLWDDDGESGKEINQKCNAFWNNLREKGSNIRNKAAKKVNRAKNVIKKTVSKGIRKIVDKGKNSKAGKKFYSATRNYNSKAVNFILDNLAGYDREEDTSYYHARKNCLQRAFGYNEFYDYVFGSATDISKPLKFQFSSKKSYRFSLKKNYVIWAWKADYLNLGAGCEMGLYSMYGTTKHYAFTPDCIYSCLKMEYKGVSHTWTPKENTWWITTFDASHQNVKASDIGFKCDADLSVLDKKVKKACVKKLKAKGSNQKNYSWEITGNNASFKWNFK